jgi:hypothetical protein
MTKPGLYVAIPNTKENEPPTLGRQLKFADLTSLKENTQIILHSHFRDKYQPQLAKARKNGNIFPIILGRRDGILGTSDLLESHNEHADGSSCVGLNHLITLGPLSDKPGRHGREKGYTLPPRTKALPTYLESKPLNRRLGHKWR